jgi:monoamine oxidase
MTVGVVGLGAAGVRTAMLLERAGASVSLFEARDRPGGRMATLDHGGGAVYEAGGEWIDADHARCLALLREFGLDPRGPVDWPRKLVHRGRECTDVTLWNDALEDDLRVEAAARELCRSLQRPPWLNRHLADLDAQRLGDFLREHTASERGLWWVTAKYRSDEGEDPDQIGLLGWLSGFLNYVDRDGHEMSAFRFPGGAGPLFARMLQTLSAEPHYGAVLTRVRQDRRGVTLEFDKGSVRVDRAVLTLPPRLLERVVFEPALSVAKRCAVEACGMSRVIKIVWEFDRRWWEEAGWGGSMLSDTPLQQTWEGGQGDAPILTAYVCGDQAADWAKMTNPVQVGVEELARLFPQAAHSFRRGWIHDWTADPFAQGAFSHLPPGYVLGHMRHLAPPEGRVHFAGEHTAIWTGFIEGALESAERVVGEVVTA